MKHTLQFCVKNSAFRSLAAWRKLWKLMTTLAVQWVDWLLMLVHLLSMHGLKLRYYHLRRMLHVVGFVNDWYWYWSILVYYRMLYVVGFVNDWYWSILVYFSQNHRFSYGEPMTVESTTQALCDLALRFGEGDEESMVYNFLALLFVTISVWLLTVLSLRPKTCELAWLLFIYKFARNVNALCVAYSECLMEM